jgi:hypothetical protein
MEPSVHLLRSDDRANEVDAFVDRVGPRVGLSGVLGDLNRTARAVTVPALAATWGFRWDPHDMRSRRWWPQGITTSADSVTGGASDDPGDATDDSRAGGTFGGRAVVVTSAYSQTVDAVNQGARLSFVDVTDPAAIRYRHVLMVEPFFRDDGAVDVRPVQVHAGGIAWHGNHIHVAATTRGFSSFRLDDIVRAPAGDTSRLGIRDRSPATVDAFGYRYLLPLRFTYDARTAAGVTKMRYSFASVDRSTTPHHLLAGEYAHSAGTTRLTSFEFDPATTLLTATPDGRSLPVTVEDAGIFGMQGATVVGGTWYLITSRGRYRLGSVWVGKPGSFREHRHQLPVGPEDLTYWPERDQLWSLSEYPGARYVFAMPRTRFL